MDEFSVSFEGPDKVVLLDIYPAGEKPIGGISSKVLYEKIRKRGSTDVIFPRSREEALDLLVAEIKYGDVLLTLGAGDVWKFGELVLEKLNAA
jgi:UDP-N-acetylmuramate--alanine ligase